MHLKMAPDALVLFMLIMLLGLLFFGSLMYKSITGLSREMRDQGYKKDDHDFLSLYFRRSLKLARAQFISLVISVLIILFFVVTQFYLRFNH